MSERAAVAARRRRASRKDSAYVIPRSEATRDLLLAPRAADHPIGVASAARLLLLLSPRGAGARASRARLHIELAASKASSPRCARDDRPSHAILSGSNTFSTTFPSTTLT